MAPGSGSQVAISPRDIIYSQSAGRSYTYRRIERVKAYHGEDRETDKGVADQQRERTALGERSSDTQEETSTDSSTESDELDVSGFQPVIRQLALVLNQGRVDGYAYPLAT